MPVDTVPAPIVDPRPHRQIIALGERSPGDYHALPGVVVSGHVGRNVSRVSLGGETVYIKREHRVRWRDRLRSRLAGFGPTSMSEREYQMIRRLREFDLPAPQTLACGEVNGESYLLVAQADDAVDLRELGELSVDFAAKLGNIVARIHDAGVDQPDMFAKHFLVNPHTEDVTILDWQRAQLRRTVSRPQRVRSLAAFRATCPDNVMPAPVWQAFLAGYAGVDRSAATPTFAADVERAARMLRRRPAIRVQLSVPAVVQELVRIDGETVCAVPSVAAQLREPGMIAALYDPANDGRTFAFASASGCTGVLQVSRYRLPLSRWLAAVRGKTWRAPELKAARLLFHLERHGIAGPKLLAYGQIAPNAFHVGSFLLAERPKRSPVTPAATETMRALLTQLHAAGCCLRRLPSATNPFGMVGERLGIVHDEQLQLKRRLTRRRMARDQRWLDAFLGAQR